MNNDFDLYGILNVNPDADFNEIKTAYRKLARKYHPDFNPSKEAEERIKLINIAYDILSDPAKRQQYDFMRRYGIHSNNVYSTNYGDTIVFKDLSEFFEFLSNLPQEELDQLMDSLFNQLFYNFFKGLIDLGARFRRRIINTFGNAFERIEKTARYILDPLGLFRKRSD